MVLRRAALLVLVLIATVTSAFASDLSVIGQATSLAAFKALVPQFEKQRGDTVHLLLSNPGLMLERLRASDHVDVVIISSKYWTTALSEGWIDAATRVSLGATKIGMGIPVAAKGPPFGNAADFIAFVRKVKTIGLVQSVGGAGTGPLFIKAVEGLGIGPEIAPKYRFFPGSGEAVANAIAAGEVETGATAISELVANKGVKIIGPLPNDVLDSGATTYAVIGSHAQNPEEARAFLRFLETPGAKQAFRAIGLIPAN